MIKRLSTVLLFIILLLFLSVAYAELEVHCVDVSQADCTVIVCDGHYMVIDGGGSDAKETVASYLRNRLGTDHLDVVIATHLHDDHIGGLPAAFKVCTVEKVYAPENQSTLVEFAEIENYMEAQGIGIIIPDEISQFTLGPAEVTIFNPMINDGNENNKSLLIIVEYAGVSFLFTGDAESGEENIAMERGYDLSSTVLHVSHHGADLCTTDEWVSYVRPQYAVISVGLGNKYSHPRQAVINNLAKYHSSIYRTDYDGTVIFNVNNDGIIDIITEKDPKNAYADVHEYLRTICKYIINVKTSSRKYHKYSKTHSMPSYENSAYVVSDENIDRLPSGCEIVTVAKLEEEWKEDKSKIYIVRQSDFDANNTKYTLCDRCK